MENGEKTCQDCAHFFRHYIRRENGFFTSTDLGHCGEPRLRNRRANDPVCRRFQAKD